MKKLFNSMIVMVFALGAFSCNEELEVVQAINEEFINISEVEIESGFLEVNYQGVEGKNSVSFEGLLESSRSGKFKIEYAVIDSKLKIKLEQNGPFGGGKNRGHIFLSGPRNIDLNLEGGSGQIYVSGVENPEMEVSMGSGFVEIRDSKVENMDFEAGSGSIAGIGLTGNLSAKVGSGKISLYQVTGNVKIVASSGNVEVSKIQGSLNSELSSGKLKMMDVSEIQSIKISSGLVEGSQIGLGPKTVLSGSSGSFSIQTISNIFDFNYDLQAGSGRVVVGESSSSGSLKINNGSPYTIRGTVSSGNIEIRR